MSYGSIYPYSWWGIATDGGYGDIYFDLSEQEISEIDAMLVDLQNRADNYENEDATKGMLEDLDECGLLEDASLVLTPTAYSEGVLHSTKPPITYSEELVVNGGFDTDSDWSKSPNWTISGGGANADGTAAGTGAIIFQSSAEITPAETFEVTYTISNYVRGTVFAGFGSQLNKQENIFFRSANGTYTEVITTTTATNFFGFRSHVDFEGSIDNVSVKKVNNADLTYTRTGTTTRTNADGNTETVAENVPVINYENFSYQDVLGSELIVNGDFSNGDSNWILDSNWQVADGRAVHNTGSPGNCIQDNIPLVSGVKYEFKYRISNRTDGLLVARFISTVVDSNVSENGERVIEFISDGNQRLVFSATSLWDGDIDNVSIREITQEVVPNSGTAGIRIEDGAVLSGGFEDLFDPQNGTLFIRCKNLADDGVRRQIILQEPVADDRIVFRYEPTSNQVETVIRDNGSGISTINHIVSDNTEYINYAITWENGSHKFYVDGVLVGENTPTITGVQGISELVTDNFNGDIQMLDVYKRVLTQSEITCINSKF